MNGEIVISKNGTDPPSDTPVVEMGSIVVCDLKGYLLHSSETSLESAQRIYEDPFEVLDDQRFQIGAGDCIPGLELSIKYALVGKPFTMRCTSKYAYGPNGRASPSAIPPNTNVEYQICLRRLEHYDCTQIDDFSKQCKHIIYSVTLRKECGNRWFSYLDYSQASRSYSKGVQVADMFFGSLETVDNEMSSNISFKELVQSRIACLNNLSSCYLLTQQYVKAKEACISVLEVDPANIKALLRAARAAMALCDYTESQACLKRLLEIDPTSVAALQEARKLKETIKMSKMKEVTFAKSMIGATEDVDLPPLGVASSFHSADTEDFHTKKTNQGVKSKWSIITILFLSLLAILLSIYLPIWYETIKAHEK